MINKVVYKESLGRQDITHKTHEITVRKDAEIIKIDYQKSHFCISIWYLCDLAEVETETIKLRFVMTGQICKAKIKRYLNTIQLNDGTFILHVFEVE